MSAKKTPENPKPPPGGGLETDANAEGWESMAEESEGTLAASPELEEALREAAAAVDGSGVVSETAGSDAPEVTAPPEVMEQTGATEQTEQTEQTGREAEDAHGEEPKPDMGRGALYPSGAGGDRRNWCWDSRGWPGPHYSCGPVLALLARIL